MPVLPEKSEYVWQPPALGPQIWLQVLRPHTWILFRWWQLPRNVGKPLLGRDSFQEVDIAGIAMPITKHSFIVKDISMLADTLRKAFYIAKSGRPGPVLVDVTKDVTAAIYEYSVRRPATINRETETIRKEDLETAAQMIEEAQKPYIFVGGGSVISGASKEISELAHKIRGTGL